MRNIYLDCCALNRPLDDQRHPQVAAEAAAIRQILLFVRWKRVCWRGAPILRVEIEACADAERKAILLSMLDDLCIEERILINRADQMLAVLQTLRLSLPDAVHVVSASKAGADTFITCDKQLLKLAGKIKPLMKLEITSPLQAACGVVAMKQIRTPEQLRRWLESLVQRTRVRRRLALPRRIFFRQG